VPPTCIGNALAGCFGYPARHDRFATSVIAKAKTLAWLHVSRNSSPIRGTPFPEPSFLDMMNPIAAREFTDAHGLVKFSILQ
jgi:hypothetical protein